MDLQSILANMNAGVTIGVGATILFAIIVAMMSMKKDAGEDEATTLYKRYNSEIENNDFDTALATALEHLPVLFKKTKNVNDLGEAFTMIAVASDRVGSFKLALVCSDIACRYLTESGVASYPLYRKCRERSQEIIANCREKLSDGEQSSAESLAAELWKNGMKSLGSSLKGLV